MMPTPTQGDSEYPGRGLIALSEFADTAGIGLRATVPLSGSIRSHASDVSEDRKSLAVFGQEHTAQAKR
jgi:hypothetical protein